MPRNGAVLTRYDIHCVIRVSDAVKNLNFAMKRTPPQAITLLHPWKHAKASMDIICESQISLNCVISMLYT